MVMIRIKHRAVKDTNELIKNYNEIFKDINEPRRYLQDKLISLFARRGSCSC